MPGQCQLEVELNRSRAVVSRLLLEMATMRALVEEQADQLRELTSENMVLQAQLAEATDEIKMQRRLLLRIAQCDAASFV